MYWIRLKLYNEMEINILGVQVISYACDLIWNRLCTREQGENSDLKDMKMC